MRLRGVVGNHGKNVLAVEGGAKAKLVNPSVENLGKQEYLR